jgi:hypothetical protein
MIGDYKSATLYDRLHCPTSQLPMKPESLSLYLDFKFGYQHSVEAIRIRECNAVG